MNSITIDSNGNISCVDCGELVVGTNPVKHSCVDFLKERITEQADTNRLLCHDLDEAQRVVEARDGRIKELEIENEKLKNLNYQLQAKPNPLGSILAK